VKPISTIPPAFFDTRPQLVPVCRFGKTILASPWSRRH
jgi:hypothetical protein